ncbi:MAG: carboxylating nicotinate-nucleotide diphosphorylase, partial [Euryarchaeota archaeon]
EEDVGRADLTSSVVRGEEAEAVIVAKEEGVVSGTLPARVAFELLDCDVEARVRDGEEVRRGQELLRVSGRAVNVLSAERVALNFLMRLSGIATATRRVVDRVRRVNPNVIVAATRKVHPITGFLEKKAVADGGGDPHRLGLDDAVLIKDNHLALVGSVEEAVRRARREVGFTKLVGVEVESPEEAEEAARAGADHVLLDNMTPERVREAVERVRRIDDAIILEASGGITPENAPEYARTGVDVISLGWLTHSAPALDLSMRVIT